MDGYRQILTFENNRRGALRRRQLIPRAAQTRLHLQFPHGPVLPRESSKQVEIGIKCIKGDSVLSPDLESFRQRRTVLKALP